MRHIYSICGKLSLIFYIFAIYQLWHLCQYGGLRSHIIKLAVAVIIGAVTFILWITARHYERNSLQKADLKGVGKKKIFYAEIFIFVITTLFFGGRIIYSAIPYNGALSWKIDEMMNKKEVKLEHNNIFESGAEGILSDLDKAFNLPDELYISNEFRITFDKSGTIQSINTFIYGKNDDGDKKTYLIDYDADKSSNMTVWSDGNVNDGYDENMRLRPMMQILKNSELRNYVDNWAEKFGEDQIYEILYFGHRSFVSMEGLKYIPGDADGDGIDTGDADFTKLMAGGEIAGFEVSLHMPDLKDVTPVRYIMEPEYISPYELEQKNSMQQADEAKNAESWTVDKSNGSMYFLLDDYNGWRLKVADAAAGSRFYIMENTSDGGAEWKIINENPFNNQSGVAQGLIFFDKNFGIIGLTGASQSNSSLYMTKDGGASFEKIELPINKAAQLPESAKKYGFTVLDYDYLNMPQKDGEALKIIVTTDAADIDGIVFESTDNGITWEYRGITKIDETALQTYTKKS